MARAAGPTLTSPDTNVREMGSPTAISDMKHVVRARYKLQYAMRLGRAPALVPSKCARSGCGLGSPSRSSPCCAVWPRCRCKRADVHPAPRPPSSSPPPWTPRPSTSPPPSPPSHPALPLCPSYGATTLLRCWMVSTDPPRLSGGEEPAEPAAPAAPAGDVHVHVGECGVVQEGRADTACEARGIVWGVPATSRGSA